MSSLQKIAPATYLLPKEGKMNVAGLVIANEELLQDPALEKPLMQVKNVAMLPGIVGYSIAMPDMHWGYGFPIGGVAAMDATKGLISPGGVGYDINCGVRLALAPLTFTELSAKQKEELLQRLYHLIPSGVGHGHKQKSLTKSDYQALLQKGAKWAVERGWSLPEDLDHIESYGILTGADPEAVSERAKERGKKQLGTIGSGNHFVEIGEVETLFSSEIAQKWGVSKGQLYILIHSGSRGLGHQVCQESVDHFIRLGHANDLPDRQLVAAPITSEEGKHYFAAMAAAANFAFCNRCMILHAVRKAFQELFSFREEQVRLLYDVCHNIAKFEEHEGQKLLVHRKGATRAYGKGHKELAPLFRESGQPVLVPGDMGRASYLLQGLGNPLTWQSSCHGAGRCSSRVASMRRWRGHDLTKEMQRKGVSFMASSMRTVAEEMPDAYKNVDRVVEAVEEAKLAARIARLKPHLVLKG